MTIERALVIVILVLLVLVLVTGWPVERWQ